MFEYLSERNDGEVWRVDAVFMRRRQPIKCKDRVLEYLRKRRYGEVWGDNAMCDKEDHI